uniref:EF-hand domain-containing protein n=1 Tax=Oxyrrhis marina TaxID=2969 RepID=A0A7S3XIR9_OXYMA
MDDDMSGELSINEFVQGLLLYNNDENMFFLHRIAGMLVAFKRYLGERLQSAPQNGGLPPPGPGRLPSGASGNARAPSGSTAVETRSADGCCPACRRPFVEDDTESLKRAMKAQAMSVFVQELERTRQAMREPVLQWPSKDGASGPTLLRFSKTPSTVTCEDLANKCETVYQLLDEQNELYSSLL